MSAARPSPLRPAGSRRSTLARAAQRGLVVLAMAAAAGPAARGGHELPVYPSYYPHEIELSAMAPDRAAALLRDGKIQAYVGRAPAFGGPPPADTDSVASLGAFIVVRVDHGSRLVRAGRSPCAVAQAVVCDMAGRGGGFVLHPYPVTPLHGDYLHHIDLAEAAAARLASGHFDPSDLEGLKVGADSAFTRSLVRPAWLTQDAQPDATVTQVDAAALVAAADRSTNGWPGPPWRRAGWHHAALLLGGDIGDAERRQRIAAELERLRAFDGDLVERINLERSLVSDLAGGCHAMIAGYTLRREYFGTAFSGGIENVAYDWLTGLNAPMFVRTVKLKDFPWNGWLALGIDTPPEARWNPIAGFGDPFGRLLWAAAGDPALIPSPNDSAWMFNRVTDVRSSAGP